MTIRLLALLFAMAAADQPVEQTKKNIQVLNGLPTSQLIPVMATMSNSLGVSCAYCHEPAWESDARPPKEAGRRMIRLTRAINEQHFGGTVVVTCNTCHNGRVETPAVPQVADAGWSKPRPPSRVEPTLPTAEELFDRYLRAWGAAASVNNRLSRGIVTAISGRGDPRSAPFEIFQALPDNVEVRTELSYPPEANREVGSQFFNATRIRDRYSEAKTVGVERVRGRDAYVVQATPKDGGRPERLVFDAGSGALLRRHREAPTAVGPLPEEYDFDDYRTVDGVIVPFVMSWSRGDYQVTHRFAEVRQNVQRP